MYAGKWHQFIIDAHPQVQVGEVDHNTNYPNDPEFGGPENVHYMPGLTRVYFDTQGISDFNSTTYVLGDFRFLASLEVGANSITWNVPHAFLSAFWASF